MKNSRFVKRLCSAFLAFAMMFLCGTELISTTVSAENSDAVGFIYTLSDQGGVKITGLTRKLTSGEDLIIPSEIDEYTVTEIDIPQAMFKVDYATMSSCLGKLEIPDTVTKITNLYAWGFSEKLVIPSSVTEIGLIDIYGPSEVEFNANVKKIGSSTEWIYNNNASEEDKINVDGYLFFTTYGSYPNPLKKISFSEGIEYLNLEGALLDPEFEVHLPDSLTYFACQNIGESTTFYLKSFPVTDEQTGEEIRRIDALSAIKNYRYYYTNDNEEFEMEDFILSPAKFNGKDSNKNLKMYRHWDAELIFTPLPLNSTAEHTFSSSNTDILEVDDNGVVSAKSVGTATISCTANEITKDCTISVYGIYIKSEDNGVVAENIEGNVDISDINTDSGVSIEINADESSGPSDEVITSIENEYEEYVVNSSYNINIQAIFNELSIPLQPSDGRKIRIKIPLINVIKDAQLLVCHKIDERIEWLECSIIEENDVTYAVFETSHFSDFYVIEIPKNTTPEIIMGDVDGDGELSAHDASVIIQAFVGIGTIDSWEVADCNCDGTVNQIDAQLILKAVTCKGFDASAQNGSEDGSIKITPLFSDAYIGSEVSFQITAEKSVTDGEFQLEAKGLTLSNYVIDGFAVFNTENTSAAFVNVSTNDVSNILRVTYIVNDDAQNISLRLIPGKRYAKDVCGTKFTATTKSLAKCVGHSILLGDDIGVKFYMELTGDFKSEESNMVFSISGNESERIPVNSAEKVTMGNKEVYVFTCGVAAAEMTDIISAQVISGEEASPVFSYSVQKYAEYILANADTNEDLLKAVPVVKAMLNYGAQAQLYFDHNTDNLANAALDDNDKILTDKSSIDLSDHHYSAIDNDAEIDFVGQIISLRNRITARIYFTESSSSQLNIDNFKVTSNGIPVDSSRLTVGADTNGQYISISEISAGDFDQIFEISVGDVTISNYSVFSYIGEALDQDDSKLVDVARAIYDYNNSVLTYAS